MVNFEELIQSLILPLVAYPEDVTISCLDSNDDSFKYEVKVNSLDFGRVIGRGGHIAQAIRTILYAGASKEGKKIYLDIVSK